MVRDGLGSEAPEPRANVENFQIAVSLTSQAPRSLSRNGKAQFINKSALNKLQAMMVAADIL